MPPDREEATRPRVCSPGLIEASLDNSWITKIMNPVRRRSNRYETMIREASTGVERPGSSRAAMPKMDIGQVVRPVSAPPMYVQVVAVKKLPALQRPMTCEQSTRPEVCKSSSNSPPEVMARPAQISVKSNSAKPHIKAPSDQHSKTELDFAAKINKIRSNPTAFAQEIFSEYRTQDAHTKDLLTAAEATNRLKTQHALLKNGREEEEALKATHEAAISELTLSHQEESTAMAKNKRKKSLEIREHEAVFLQKLSEVKAAHKKERDTLSKVLDKTDAEARSCSELIEKISEITAFYSSRPAVPPVRYYRGLSLIARERNTEKDIYGLTMGETVILQGETLVKDGPVSPYKALYDLSLSQKNRETLLKETLVALGSGCLQKREKTLFTFVFCCGFQDSRHVRVRKHLSLQNIQHQAKFSSDPLLYPMTFLKDVSAVKPLEHPVTDSEFFLRVEPETEILCSYEEYRPISGSGSILLQYLSETKVSVHTMPVKDGLVSLHVFSKQKCETSFGWVGRVVVRKTTPGIPERFFRPTHEHRRLRAVVKSPLMSPLTEGFTYRFEVVLPENGLGAEVLELKEELSRAEESADVITTRVLKDKLRRKQVKETALQRVNVTLPSNSVRTLAQTVCRDDHNSNNSSGTNTFVKDIKVVGCGTLAMFVDSTCIGSWLVS
eukprot:TRINITY_DN22284_c0_g1_i1.p1 TRINITY_DN22284_c0_g1~~TRINITY_DN22284_c0_g1_i1.p1  ORF type:complete len:691 (+),score=140.72 TRINITY_DN22284_c0_g1_i1:69-2075(+)